MGKKTQRTLERLGHSSEQSLIDLYRSLRPFKGTQEEHCQAFYDHLASNGIDSHLNDLVVQISEKAQHLSSLAKNENQKIGVRQKISSGMERSLSPVMRSLPLIIAVLIVAMVSYLVARYIG